MTSWFWDDLERFGESIALTNEDGQEISYQALAQAADAYVAQIGPGRQLVLIEAANNAASIIALIACLRARHPVILSSGTGVARISETFAPNVVIDPDGVVSRYSSLPHDLHDDLALMLSTSGSTGTAKLVRLSHEALHANAGSIADYLGIDGTDVPITTLPIAYSYGLSVVTSHLLRGARIVLTDRSVIDDGFWTLFHAQRVTSLAGVPYTYELLEASGFRERDTATLRTLTQAGGRIDSGIRAHYADWASDKGVRFFVMYGQTEATARIAYLPPELNASHADCIGRAIPGGTLRIEDAEGQPLPSGETGELVYAGPNVMLGYATTPAELARGRDITVLRTGDLGQEAAPGIFRIVGRLSRFSKIAGLRIGLDEIEALLASSGIRAIVTGDDELIAVCIENADQCDRATALIECRMAIPPRALLTFSPDSVPRLPSGKPDSPAILRAAKTLKAERDAADAEGSASSLTAIYARALNRQEVTPEQSFASLGGDSLGYIEVSMAIDRLLGYLPAHWESLSIVQIEQLAAAQPPAAPSRFATAQTEMLVRPVAMTTIVAAHAMGGIESLKDIAPLLGGGALALLMSAGYNLQRFQKQKMLSGAPLSALGSFLRRIALPFYLLILYKCVQWLAGGPHVAWSSFLLLDDYVRDPQAANFLIYWFIGVLFQCILVVTALFHVPPIRDFARRSGFRFGLALFALASVAKVAMHIALPPDGALMYPNNQLDHWAYAFALGWMVGEARSETEKLCCLALGLVASSIDWGVIDFHTILLMIAMGLVLYKPFVRLPKLLVDPLALWANATFFIYLTHGFAMGAMRSEAIRSRFAEADIAYVAATVLLATAGGIIFYLAWKQGETILARLADRLGPYQRRTASKIEPQAAPTPSSPNTANQKA